MGKFFFIGSGSLARVTRLFLRVFFFGANVMLRYESENEYGATLGQANRLRYFHHGEVQGHPRKLLEPGEKGVTPRP